RQAPGRPVRADELAGRAGGPGVAAVPGPVRRLAGRPGLLGPAAVGPRPVRVRCRPRGRRRLLAVHRRHPPRGRGPGAESGDHPRTCVLIAECIHEVCSFNPVPTRYADFFVNAGGRLLDYHRGTGSEVAGALEVFAGEPGLEVIPTYGARG